MPTQTPTVTPNWNGLEGKVLEGGYEIEQCLDAGETSASFKIRVLGDRFTSAIAHIEAPGTVKPEQMALWKEAVQLRHPNLSSPMSAGSFDFDDAALPYRVLVRPDETLAGVIKERPLTPEETREVLNSVVSALEYLHASGFAHSGVSPEQVLGIGDSVKLSSGSIRRINSPLEGEENPSPAADVFRLGATVFEVFMQKLCTGSCRDDAAKLPTPFDSIVQRSLDPDAQSRCSLADIRAMLAGRQLRSAVKPEVVKPEAVKPATAAAVAKPVVAQRETPRPAQPTAQASPVLRRERGEVAHESSLFRKGAYVLLALLLAVGVLWLARPKGSGRHAVVSSGTGKGPVQTPGKPVSASGTAWPTRAVGPQPARSSNAAPRNATTAPVVMGKAGKGQVWRVISFTYNRESDAQKRVEWINATYPGFNPEVFSPSGQGGPYLIVLGGGMTREDAVRLRQRARASGLPRDSYIQNYNR